jgi:hypothetical protein
VAELATGNWDFPWDLAPGLTAPVRDPAARHAAVTLERMLERPVRSALAVGWEGRTALDLSCGEGRLAHRLLGWNATHVVGVNSDGVRLRRAELLRHHFALPASAIALRGAGDPDDLDAASLGKFDVVLLIGIADRDPGTRARVRLAAACAGALCVIETAGPDLESITAAMRAAGFASVRRVAPTPDAERRYVLGERVVLTARVEAAR